MQLFLSLTIKVVLQGFHRYFFWVKTVRLIGGSQGEDFWQPLAASMLLYMPAQIIQMMAFTQIMAIWTPEISLQDHLKKSHLLKPVCGRFGMWYTAYFLFDICCDQLAKSRPTFQVFLLKQSLQLSKPYKYLSNWIYMFVFFPKLIHLYPTTFSKELHCVPNIWSGSDICFKPEYTLSGLTRYLLFDQVLTFRY